MLERNSLVQRVDRDRKRGRLSGATIYRSFQVSLRDRPPICCFSPNLGFVGVLAPESLAFDLFLCALLFACFPISPPKALVRH